MTLPAALVLAASGLLARAAQPFPLNKGTAWTYRGTVTWWSDEKRDAVERPITWTMTVIGRVVTSLLEIATALGPPQDLAWYSPGRQPRKYLTGRAAGSRITRSTPTGSRQR